MSEQDVAEFMRQYHSKGGFNRQHPGAANVTVIPVAGDPLLVTVATRGLENAVPTVAVCPVPPVDVIAVVAAGFELEPQPVNKCMGKTISARIVKLDLWLIGNPISVQLLR